MGDAAAARAADHPERHQPTALRDAQGHHGGAAQAGAQGGAGRTGRGGQRILRLYVPEKDKQTKLFEGAPAAAAGELVRALREEARVLGG